MRGTTFITREYEFFREAMRFVTNYYRGACSLFVQGKFTMEMSATELTITYEQEQSKEVFKIPMLVKDRRSLDEFMYLCQETVICMYYQQVYDPSQRDEPIMRLRTLSALLGVTIQSVSHELLTIEMNIVQSATKLFDLAEKLALEKRINQNDIKGLKRLVLELLK